MRPVRARLVLAATALAIIAVWHLVVVGWEFSPLVLPSPARVAQSFGTNLANGLLLTHLWVTLEEIAFRIHRRICRQWRRGNIKRASPDFNLLITVFLRGFFFV